MQELMTSYFGERMLGPGNAQRVFDNSSLSDIMQVRPRLYQTFDQQFPPIFSEATIEYVESVAGPTATQVLGSVQKSWTSFLWFADQWYAPWIAVLTYLVVVLTLQKIFWVPKEKRTDKLGWLVFLHNGVVALESIYMFVMFSKQLFLYLSNNGLGYWGLYCDPGHTLDADSDFRFYESLFYLSKWHELFDTVLLVVRGRSASTLQLFHHTIMLLVTYYNRWPYVIPGMWLSVYLNLIVHIAMYSYFALSAVGIKLEAVRIYMTRAQILQFWIILLHAAPWPYFRHVYGCMGHISSWLWVVLPVTGINLLFLRFYIRSYHTPEKLKIQ